MKIRRRLGVFATALSGLLAAGLLFSAPAFAWDTELKDLSTSCPPGSEQPRVDFTLKLFESGHEGRVKAFFKIGDSHEAQPVEELLDENGEAGGSFGKDASELKLHFLVDNPSEDTTITVIVVTLFKDLPQGEKPPVSKAKTDLGKCVHEEESSSTTTTTTEIEQPASAAPSTQAPTTLGAPSTSEEIEQQGLPKTGSSAVPMLIAALVLMTVGGAALLAGRVRGRHAR
jgi:LPXTG-motif cell wall-anchored protein